MQSDPGLQARLAAQRLRLVQRHSRVEHLEVVVITPHQRLGLGSEWSPRLLRAVLEEVLWISLEDLSRRPELDPLLNPLTLPIRPDLATVVLPLLIQRVPQRSEEAIMVVAGIPCEEIRHTRAVPQWLAEGRQEGLQEGRQEGEAAVVLRLLNRRCGPLSEVITSRIQRLPLERLEALAEALLDFQGPEDLAAWFAAEADSPD